MKKIIIHPTHRKILRLLRERKNNGVPVVVLKKELEEVMETLTTFPSPTARNQYVYRVLLRAMNRPLSEIQHCTGFIVLDSKNINVIESIYARVERMHLCSTLINTWDLNRRRKVISSRC